MKTRLYKALGAYGILAALAAFTLDGPFRAVILVFLGGLALKTWIAFKRG
jgi:hypothetical protein